MSKLTGKGRSCHRRIQRHRSGHRQVTGRGRSIRSRELRFQQGWRGHCGRRHHRSRWQGSRRLAPLRRSVSRALIL